MARVFLAKTLTGFAPADEASKELWRKYKTGDIYRADIVRPRSYPHHKLCMALLNLTYENLPERYQERYQSFDSFRYAVAKKAGHCEEFVDLDGEISTVPKSISYDEIPDDVEFGRVMAAMMTVCATILDMGESRLSEEVSRYADRHYGRAAA